VSEELVSRSRSITMRPLLVLALAACEGARTPVQPAPVANQGSAAPAALALPPLYAKLFVAGEKTFPAEVNTAELWG
jgi:hypothetical protein